MLAETGNNYDFWVKIGVMLFAAGGTTALVRRSLGDLTEAVKDLRTNIQPLLINDGKQGIINSTIDEKIETLNDRVDIQDEAIRGLECTQQTIKEDMAVVKNVLKLTN